MGDKDQRSTAQQLWDAGSSAVSTVGDSLAYAGEELYDGLEYGNQAVQEELRAAQDTAVKGVHAGQQAVSDAGAAASAWYDPDVESQEVQDQVLAATQDIPNQDIIYEQLAHNLAYGRWDQKQLTLWGYREPEEVIEVDPVTGMSLWVVQPANEPNAVSDKEEMHGKPLRAVLCFRGSADAVDWADDLSPEGVGAFQFSAHQGEIAKYVSENAKWGPPDTTGHSLGGALAQLAATVGSVNRVVTFQSPGISQEYLDQAQTQEDATHHRAKNDLVAWAGDAHLEGDAYIYDQTGAGFEPGLSHTYTMLNDLSTRRGEDGVPGLEDPGFDKNPDHGRLAYVSQEAPDWNMDGETGAWEQAYQDGRQWAAGTGRDLLGSGLRTADDLMSTGIAINDATTLGDQSVDNQGLTTSGVAGVGGMVTEGESMNVDPQDMQCYIQLWQELEPQIAQGVCYEELDTQITASGLEEGLAKQMRQQVKLIDQYGGARDVTV